MSKKTDQEKRQRAAKKRAATRKPRKGRGPNPAKIAGRSAAGPIGLFGDAIFMHHALGLLFRYLELTDARFPARHSPSEFIKPTGLTGTVSPDSPDENEPKKAQD